MCHYSCQSREDTQAARRKETLSSYLGLLGAVAVVALLLLLWLLLLPLDQGVQAIVAGLPQQIRAIVQERRLLWLWLLIVEIAWLTTGKPFSPVLDEEAKDECLNLLVAETTPTLFAG